MGRVLLLCVIGLFLLTGCVTPSTILVNDQGDAKRCASYGTGLYGMATAESIHSTCVTDFKKVGYVPLPETWMGLYPVKGSTVIERVVPQLGAAEAGLLPGDRITHLDGTSALYMTDQARVMSPKKPGDIVRVTVERDGQVLVFPVIVQARGK